MSNSYPFIVTALIICGWLLLLLFFKYCKIWIAYFVCGVGGFCIIGALIGRNSWLEKALASSSVSICSHISSFIGLKVQSFTDAGIMLISSAHFSGFSSMAIDIECSGLLELVLLWALLLFFPIFNREERVWYMVWGSTLVYLINIIRIMVILLAVSLWGRDSIYIVHTVIARGIFFFLMIVLYWEIFTRKSISYIRSLK